MTLKIESIDWDKVQGLIPAVIQNADSLQVLMLGYMDQEALQKTIDDQKVCFFSRTKNRLWTKGETSGDFLYVKSIALDCDHDTLLVSVIPEGKTCHLGTTSCFGEGIEHHSIGFLNHLSDLVEKRRKTFESGLAQNTAGKKSYTAELFEKGTKRIAQKVGEEGVEVALAATVADKEELKNESADLLFHLVVLLSAQGLSLTDIVSTLQERHHEG